MLIREQAQELESRVDPEEITQIVMKLQRRFLLNLSEELGRGSISFPQFFLLDSLVRQEMITMSGIALKMGHSTAAATGLVDRLEKLGYVARAHAENDRRKVMVRITEKGSRLVTAIREDMAKKIKVLLQDYLTAEEGIAWLHIYRKIATYCDKLPCNKS
jgi:DNA-binding MarR family transcriptional regulator